MTNFINERLKRIQGILVCPECSGELNFLPNRALCKVCNRDFMIKNGKIYFISVAMHQDHSDQTRSWLKNRLGKYYYTLGVDVLAPTYPFDMKKEILHWLDPEQSVVVDIGCGNRRLMESVICVDMFDYNSVDIVCDVKSLPFRDNTVDAFVSRSVLEHVVDPKVLAQHLTQKTKKGGIGLHLIPFMYPFHASPADYQRYTHEGVRFLFNDWEIIYQSNVTGPVTLFMVCAIEFLSILFSFGNHKLKTYVYLGLCALLFPFKYLDFVFVRKSRYLTLAPTILTIFRSKYE